MLNSLCGGEKRTLLRRPTSAIPRTPYTVLHTANYFLPTVLESFRDTTLYNGHHYAFIVEVMNPAGTLKERTHKAENVWLTLDEYKAKNHFPHDWTLEHVIPSEKVLAIEAELIMENGKCIEQKLVSLSEL